MDTPTKSFRYLFGEESCEDEVKVLRDTYQEYYYDQSRFNTEALHPEVYLIVGRRGSGKTSLGKYFEFQDQIKKARCIDVNEPEAYDDILRNITPRTAYDNEVLISRIVKLWDYVLWSLIFQTYRDKDPAIAAACLVPQKSRPAQLISDLLRHLLDRHSDNDEIAIADEIDQFLTSATFAAARNKTIEISRVEPVIVAIDTLERYDKDDDILMKVTSALIQCAKNFNVSYARRGIHIKAFVSAEIFPHIKESAISNTTKFIRYPVYLHWRPRDLVRLICWRFHRFLEISDPHQPYAPAEVEWSNFNDVLEKMWYPFFGEIVKNGNGFTEKSFPYIIRHTQMRPRQLVVLCNTIARATIRGGKFPYFKEMPIASIIKESERDLSDEVLNSYAKIYPQVAEIVDALRTAPLMFKGNLLDRVAKKTAAAWPSRMAYSMGNFRRLVAELGIVGRVRHHDAGSGIIEADFEYTLPDRLALLDDDLCVIHPMFYTKLQTQLDGRTIVYPFPDHPDYHELIGK